jgi:hypothetical protein
MTRVSFRKQSNGAVGISLMQLGSFVVRGVLDHSFEERDSGAACSGQTRQPYSLKPKFSWQICSHGLKRTSYWP